MTFEQAVKGIDGHVWSSEKEVGEFIVSLKHLCKFKDILEVGVFKGLTSCHILEDKKVGECYVAIDIEDHRPETVKEYFEEQGGDFVLGDSLVEMKKLPSNSFDLIFLDSYHGLEQVRSEFQIAEKLIRQNGLICIHDYFTSDGVPAWVDYLKECQFKGELPGLEIVNLDTPEHRGFTIVKHLYSK